MLDDVVLATRIPQTGEEHTVFPVLLFIFDVFCLQKSIPRHFCCSLSHWIISGLFKATFRVRKQKSKKQKNKLKEYRALLI